MALCGPQWLKDCNVITRLTEMLAACGPPSDRCSARNALAALHNPVGDVALHVLVSAPAFVAGGTPRGPPHQVHVETLGPNVSGQRSRIHLRGP